MSDAQLFLCVVLFFYVSGRCLWRPVRTLAFRSILFSPYRAVVEPSALSSRRGSLLVADPFVPLRPVYLVDLPPLLFAPGGIAIASGAEPIGLELGLSWIPYENVGAVASSDRSLTINGETVRCRTAATATALAAELESLRRASPSERADRIRSEMKPAFNLREARRILRKTTAGVNQLRFSANAWLAGIFSAYLLTAALFGYATMTLWLLLALEAAAIHLSVQYYRLHRRFFPEEGRVRAGELVKFLCCSPTVFQCVDALAAGMLAQFHPAVVAHLVCEPAEFDRHCARWLRALRHGKPAGNEQESWVRTESERLLEAFLQSVGRSPEQYLASPARHDLASKSYCPRCEAQYRFANGECPDCEVCVQPFPIASDEGP